MTTEKIENQEQTEKTATTPEGTEQQQEVQYTPVQLKAIEQGWIPKEEFDGDEDEFIDAAEFVRRGELFAKISSQSKKLQQLEESLVALKQHNSNIRKVEYERALKALKQEMRKAQVEGDTERAFALEDRMEEIQAEAKAVVNQPDEAPGPTPEFLEWVESNPWYETNEVMRDAADAMGRRLHARYKNDMVGLLEAVEKHIKKEFEHKFKSPNTKKPNAVEGSSRSSGKNNDDLVMTEQERDMMKKIVRTGALTEAEYKAQLKTIKAQK